MTNIILGIAIAALSLTSCNNSNSKIAENKNANKDTVQVKSQADTSITPTPIVADEKATVTIKEIISTYLQMKNAFAKDNTNDAATAGKSLQAAFINFDIKTLSAQQAKTFADIADDAKEHAEHIGANGGKIAHQREHFIMLSKDMADLIKIFGNGGQTLYKDFCPMANDGKGATWISETKDIKNPYLGKAMPTCGSVKETIQ